jgi:hypothetical protein
LESGAGAPHSKAAFGPRAVKASWGWHVSSLSKKSLSKPLTVAALCGNQHGNSFLL